MAKRDKLKVKSILPKEENIPKASGEIVLRKDTDLDILCFDRNIDGFYSVSVRLWPQNHPTAPQHLKYLFCLRPIVFTIVNDLV